VQFGEGSADAAQAEPHGERHRWDGQPANERQIDDHAGGGERFAGEALASAGVVVDLALVRGLAIPAVALAVWLGLRRVRRSLAKLHAGAEDDA